MATRKSSIGASLVIDRRQFKKALEESRGDAAKFAASLEAIRMPRQGVLAPGSWDSGLRGVIGRYQHLRGVVTDVAGLIVRTAGAPAMYNDMADSLRAVTGSAEEARQALDFIAGVAEEQKLEFEPLVEAYERMRALGYSAQQTRDFIREMGNAIEASGGDAHDLTAVVSALSKIKDKGELSAKALHQMGESMPFLRKIMEEQFGAGTAAEITELGLSMEELFEGIVRGLRRVETNKGGYLDTMSPEYLASMKRLEAGRRAMGLGESLTNIPDLPERTPDAVDPEGDAARIRMLRERAAAAKSAAEAEKRLKDETEAAAEEAKRMEEENAVIAEREAGQKSFAADAAEEMEIARLRSRGQNKKADKMQRDRDERQRVQQLMEAGGLSEQAAKSMAAGERGIQEDQDYFDRTGRRKVRGGNFKTGFTGIPDFADTSLKDEWNFPALAEAREFRSRPPEPNLDRRSRDQLGVSPDKFSGMTIKQADEMLEVLRAIRSATEKSQPTVGERLSPRAA
jgi:tape measure domain-containing protein